MPSITLRADDVATSYRRFSIAKISFELASGDCMGLVGRSGAGKSTLLKTLLGLKQPEQGTITVTLDGKEVGLSDVVGYSPQDNALYPYLTVEENMFVFGELQHLSKKEILQRMGALLPRLDLGSSRHKKIIELSGGMQKRADLAAALLSFPPILILDEPFNGLDISLQSFIWELLKEIAAQGRIVIVSSHMLLDIRKHCNQFGLIDNGAFYNTKQILQSLKNSKGMLLENYLERLFAKDLRRGE